MLRYLEALQARDRDALVAVVAPDVVAHAPGGRPGVEGFEAWFDAVCDPTFVDERCLVEDVVAEGDRVVVRYTVEVTHAGPFLGIAPTGRRISSTGIKIYRIRAGRIAEMWGEQDVVGLYQAIGGSWPPPG